MKPRFSLVIPTIRNLDLFFQKWRKTIEKYNPEIIIVEDRDKPTIKIPDWVIEAKVYSRKAIRKDLGKKLSKIIPTQSDGIRSYGFLKATGDIIISLDDDCYPMNNLHMFHHEVTLEAKYKCSPFYDIFNGEIQPRGYPYNVREEKECVFNLGLWEGDVDFDAPTELLDLNHFGFNEGVVQKGLMLPICVMNVAFKRELVPIYYQLPPGPYQRFHDIWSGFIMKKIIDAIDKVMCVGAPYIEHKRKSKTMDNLVKEAKGIRANEIMWKIIYNIDIPPRYRTSYNSCYKYMADTFIALGKEGVFDEEFSDYLVKCGKSMKLWLQFCKETKY